MALTARVFGTILLVVAAAQAIASQPREVAKPGVLFTGTSLPKPPQQERRWQPPASRLPEKWITATVELYRCGFADPRGCEYREVKLTCGSSLWGGSSLVTVHAWVLPEGKEAKPDRQRFAVTWTGIVYPVVDVGPPVKLADDVESLMKAFAAAQYDNTYTGHAFVRGHPQFAERRMRFAPESSLVAHDYMFALKSCLLLRLGEGELAARVWYAWLDANRALMSEAKSPDGDPYMVLAWEWGWALFDHAIAAHLRGDDVVAFDAAKTLVPFKESVPRVAARRGILQRKSLANDNPLDYLPLYDPPETLLEDAARRVKAGPVRRAMDVGLEKYPDQSQRIAALVRDLEDVSAGPDYEAGRVPLSPPYIVFDTMGQPVNPLKTSPIVQALIKEGEEAVEPLLKCLVDDRRLTRVAGTGYHETSGDLLWPRDLITVDVAAYTALCGILKSEHFGLATDGPYYYNGKGREERRAVADEIRRRFERIKGLPREDAWLSVLADPNLTGKAWLEAAEQIVAPAGRMPATEAQPEYHVGNGEPFDGAPMAGEALRKMQNPSVTQLLTQRCDDSGSADLAICLAKWDRKAAIPVLDRRISESCRVLRGEARPDATDPLLRLVEVALQLGDERAALEYAAWLRSIRPDNLPYLELSIFMPAWRHPDNPKLAELTRSLFLADDSPWHPIHKLKPPCAYEMICSPMVGVPAFRELLKRELDNVSPVGGFTIEQNGVSMNVMNNGMGTASDYLPDVELPKVGAAHPLRACDYYAVQLSRLEGAPRFELYWSQPRRDAARKGIARFLEHWGDCIRDRSKSLETWYSPSSRPRFHLSPRVQPATAEDVAAGRAIFTLRDRADAQVRTVPLKPYPHIARWKTLTQFPLQRPSVMEWPKDRTSKDAKAWAALLKESYDREGLIWQAEEVLQDGKSRRYYGFVGNHVIAKVPAEEIELLDEFSPAHPYRW